MQSFGKPPAAALGLQRLSPWLRVATTGGVLIAVGVYLAQVLLPTPLTPATVTGTAGGQTENAEMLAKAETKAYYEGRLAEATNQPQARAQIEIEAARQQQQLRTDSLATQAGLANLADLFCIGGQAIAALGRDQTGDEAHKNAQAVAHATCGAGDAIRNNMTQQQADAARTGGALMNRNLYGQPTAPAPVAHAPN